MDAVSALGTCEYALLTGAENDRLDALAAIQEARSEIMTPHGLTAVREEVMDDE
ncbi:MAG: hypothetical protein V4529_17310 [Gemmatimonadota bacterium]